ncbi:DUF4397 domain-containing protein [Pedobacter caeni]|uniref:DUF4397 domain-containing protein n=1 Tax=Pedobacter caeni TaxID=288992 RepID=A0A1M5BY05_9SPHI|nr:DUF4397 domain-containing protein [Pedobacter caeni]SHF47321.1 hypothetical protein SAMN04488522_1021404 [Pedobacter caeni]
MGVIRNFIYILSFALILITLQACKKDKIGFQEDNRIQQEVINTSKLRVINLIDMNQVIVNNRDSLTNFIQDDGSGQNYLKRTRYFSLNGRLGKTWNIPQAILNSTKATDIRLEANGPQLSIGKVSFQVKETDTRAKDYYVWTSEKFVEPDYPQSRVLEIPRDETGPQRAGYFKIRIINLAAKIKSSGQGTTPDTEDLLDQYTLSYANGDAIHQRTSQIAQGKWSEYVEIPYGTYQFRVLTSDQRQLPYGQNPPVAETTAAVDPATSSITERFQKGQYISFAPIKNYMPGGVYTIVISPRSLNHYMDEGGSFIPNFQNAFEIIEDIAPPANITLAHLQAVNALPGSSDISLRIAGQIINQIAYGKASPYQMFTKGSYKLEALDANQKVLATTDVLLDANDNVSAWVNQNAQGQTQISVAHNNLTGYWYVPGGQDNAVYNQITQLFPFNARFFNFCPEEPYLTFAQRTGEKIGAGGGAEQQYYTEPAAFQNLQPGQVINRYPYVNMGGAITAPFNIYAFQSKPNSVPGNWLPDLKNISGQDFIANKDLYTVRGNLPTHERGYYSVALIGSYKATSPAHKPKIIIIKHNQ